MSRRDPSGFTPVGKIIALILIGALTIVLKICAKQ